MNHLPIFTVVIPLYNAQRYIARTLESVRAQSFTDFEVVVVDDGSCDDGPAIVEARMCEDTRIRLITQDNRGLAGARNTGIRYARGSYIAFLDADDIWLPRKLEVHKAHLDADTTVGLSYAPSLFIDQNGNALGIGQHPRLTGIDADHVFCRNPVGNGSAPVLRRAALDEIAFEISVPQGRRRCWFDESFRQSEDIELWTRLSATTAWRIEGVAEPLTLYRIHTGALSSNTAAQLATWHRFRSKIALISPDLIARSGHRSEAYQLRYLARRSAMNGAGVEAFRLSTKSIWRHPRILIEEPKRTIQTLGFSLLAAALPLDAFNIVKKICFWPSSVDGL